jgi:hypothetical protein
MPLAYPCDHGVSSKVLSILSSFFPQPKVISSRTQGHASRGEEQMPKLLPTFKNLDA